MKIISFLVCDDIRNEVGGKSSIMGVYANSIEFGVTPENKNQWPKAMRVGIFVNIKLEDSDRKKNINSFSLKIDCNGKIEEVAQGNFNPKDIPISHSVNLAIVHNHFPFNEPGEMRFSLDFSDAKNDVIETIAPDYILRISEKINQ
jgi:hypothetical protein